MITCPRDGTALTVEGGDPLLGEVLGDRYRILERISAGGMGQVYRAAHTRIASLCAVKVLFGELAGEEDMRTRFEREAEAASILQSRYITRVIDFGETKTGLLYLVMELIDGVCMANAITKSQGFSEERAASIVRRIALGLAHAHERGIVHRDLKPQNVMLVSEDGEPDVPKILDFGIARINERPGVTMPGMVMGTPQYMAPEQFTGIDVDARSDLYALGVMLYQAVTGSTPFDGPSSSAIFELHRLAKPPPFQKARPGFTTSRRFEEVVFRLLAKKPDDRFPSARALVEALEFRFESTAEVTRKTANPLPPEDPRDLAVDRIQRAIQRGAPLYNSGDSKGCAELYLKTSKELIATELAGRDHAVLRLRLSTAVSRTFGREAQGAAWELRYGFDDLLFALGEFKRLPTTGATKAERRRESRFAAGCPGLVSIRRELDLAALVAARRYDAGHAEVVGDFFLMLAQELCDRLAKDGTCNTVRKRLADGLDDARQSVSRAEAAAVLGDAFDEVRFDGSSQAAPPAEAAVLAASEQIEEVGNAILAAISSGSTLYNSGDIDGCARLYLETATQMDATLRAGPRNAPLKRLLAGALEKARTSEPNDAAWTLRHAFDAVLEAWRIAHNPLGVSAVKRER